jgi:hypothetical protein
VLSEAKTEAKVTVQHLLFFVRHKLRLKKQPSIYCTLCAAKAEAKEIVQRLLFFVRHKLRFKKQPSIYCVLSEAKSASTMFFL